MYKWAGKQVYEPLPPLNGHYSIQPNLAEEKPKRSG